MMKHSHCRKPQMLTLGDGIVRTTNSNHFYMGDFYVEDDFLIGRLVLENSDYFVQIPVTDIESVKAENLNLYNKETR